MRIFKSVNLLNSAILVIIFCFNIVSGKEIKKENVTFSVSDEIALKYPALIDLVIATESMDDEERQYWFDIFPGMTEVQILGLYDILETERKKLADLEKKYQKQIKEINAKHYREYVAEAFSEKIKGMPAEKAQELKVLVANSTRNPAFELKKYNSLSKDEYILTVPEYELFAELNKISEIDNLILLNHISDMIEKRELYESGYPKEILEAYFDKGAYLAARHKNNNLLFKISQVSKKHQEIVFFESGLYSEIAKKRYSKSLANDKPLDNPNISAIIQIGRELTYLRGNKECLVYCGQLLIKLDKIVEKNYKKIIADFTLKLKDVPRRHWYKPMWLDLVITFNSTLELNALDTLKKDILDIVTKSDPKGDAELKWYDALQRDYFSGNRGQIYTKIRSKRKDRLLERDFLGVSSLDGKLIESGVFSSIIHIKSGDRRKALETLMELKDIGTSASSNAFGYLEHDLRTFLLKVLTSSDFGIKGPRKLLVTNNTGDFIEPRNKYAIIVGISDYDELPSKLTPDSNLLDELIDLKYADNDALGFKNFLDNPNTSGGNWNIAYYTNSDATMSKVRGKISEVFNKAKEDDLIYVFFSGHGRSVDSKGDETFLMTADAGPKDLYVGIDLNWFSGAIQKTKAQHVVAFIDACRSGSTNTGKGAAQIEASYINRIQSNHSRTKVIFSSGTGSQVSYEDDQSKHGYFTKFLLKALTEGSAPEINKDGMVGLFEAGIYVAEEVRKATNDRQEPQVPNLADFGKRSVSFPLALR